MSKPPTKGNDPSDPMGSSPASFTTSFEEMVASQSTMTRQRLNGLLEGLTDFNDEMTQMICLQTVCDYLSIGTEDNLGNFRISPFCNAFAALLNHPYNPEIMLLAARAITHLLEALPNSTSNVVSAGVIPPLISKLETIEFIDVAEISLQALEKISVECGHDILLAHGLMAVLLYIEFFRLEVQRTAISTAANICRRATSDSWDLVEGGIVPLQNLLFGSDRIVVDKSCQCLAWLVERFSKSPAKLETLLPERILLKIVSLISDPASIISQKTRTILFRVLSVSCGGSPIIVITLFELDICPTLRSFLTSETGGITSASCLPEQSFEILSLILVLLPSLPSDWRYDMDLPKGDESDAPVLQNPSLLKKAVECLLQAVCEVYTWAARPALKSKALEIILTLVHFSSPQMLAEAFQDIPISGFVASLLSRAEGQTSEDDGVYIAVVAGIKLAQLLLHKLPKVFWHYFTREGVFHELENLRSHPPSVDETLTLSVGESQQLGDSSGSPLDPQSEFGDGSSSSSRYPNFRSLMQSPGSSPAGGHGRVSLSTLMHSP
eukprot:CAMPEP_0201504874 /NCGR_PEP_ID=MMETSP0151_2-20130828/85450_1 /ASSEMBLY_ACC=CAM_ASM_000257 /TAXON_ID=200890 /ORGANISM="Paramoeba atlantica, Strain 621/1 / CCAP 1560/9" /LENGTH=551 /DNA_ID=CAMNT_0047898671 /DNA_START=391 /DNA_END=2042 /DNA_ORIENTATION=-